MPWRSDVSELDRSILDAAATATIVLRDEIVIYANGAAGAAANRPAAELIGRNFLDFVAPEEVERVRERQRSRLRGEPVPDEYQVVLLGRSGRRPFRITAAKMGSDFVIELTDMSQLETHRSRLARLAQLGVSVQMEREEERVLSTVQRELHRIDLFAVLLLPKAGVIEVGFISAPPDLREAIDEAFGRPLAGSRWIWTDYAEHIWTQGAVYTDDWPMEVKRAAQMEQAEKAREFAASVGLSRAIGMRLDVLGRPYALLIMAASWLRESDEPAFHLFGLQVSAALSAASTIRHLTQRNADLAALNGLAQTAGTARDLSDFLEPAGAEVRRSVGCQGFAVYLFDQARAHAVLAHQAGGTEAAARAVARLSLGAPLLSQLVTDGISRVVQLEEFPHEIQTSLRETGLQTFALVPLKVRSTAVGMLVVSFAEWRAPEACSVELLEAMSAHFAAAVESQRLVGDLRRRVSELTLLNDIAVASTVLDPVALLESVMHRVVATFEADVGTAYLLRGEELTRVVSIGLSEETRRELDALPTEGGAPAEAVRTLAPVLVPNMATGPDRARVMHVREGVETSVALPLVAKSRALGAFAVCRRAPRPFEEGEVRLLAAVGAQVGMAVEGARLFAETRQRVEELSLIHEVGRTIAGSLDLDRVLKEGAAAMQRLVGATRCSVLLYDSARRELRLGAIAGEPAAEHREGRLPAGALALGTKVVRGRRLIAVEDVESDPDAVRGPNGEVGVKSVLAAPLLVREEPVGVVLVVECRDRRRYSTAEIDRVAGLANQLAVAIDNARLYAEAQRRLAEVAAVNHVARVVSSSLELDRVLEAGAEHLMRTLEAGGCAILLARADAPGSALRRAAECGEPMDVGLLSREGPSIVHDALQLQGPVAGRLGHEAGQPPTRAALAVPLYAREQLLGVAVIADREGTRIFTEGEMSRALAIASQLAVAVEHARLYQDLRKSYADLARAQEQLIERERLAALGELAAVVAHEVRNPLGVIFNSLGSLRRLVRPQGDARVLFEILGEEADRLNRIIGDLLDFARPTTPTLRPEALDRVLEDAVTAALSGSAQRIVVEQEFDPTLPAVAMDSRLLRQALLNVAANAVQAMEPGGKLTVKASREGGFARVEIGDNGAGIPDEILHRIFEPFFTTKASGTGLGLAVVKRIIDGHRGEISVTSQAGAGTVFTIRLPIEAQAAAPAGLTP